MNLNKFLDLSKEIKDDYLNKDTFPTLDLSIEGIEESIEKVKKECFEGEILIEEMDKMLSELYSKLIAITSSTDYSIEEIKYVDKVMRELENRREQIYDVYKRRSELKIELELLKADLLRETDSRSDNDNLSNNDESILGRLEELEDIDERDEIMF